MPRLIDANRAFEKADEVTFMGFRAEERKRHFMDLVSVILDCPTVDAVEVVRCKDCKYYDCGNGHRPWCNHLNGLDEMHDDDFCSYGERKYDGNNNT